MQRRRLIFHIGVHRTATTALQHYLFQNRHAMAKGGVLYPFETSRHLDQFDQMFKKTIFPRRIINGLKQSVTDCPHDIHTILMSDEDICKRQNLNLLTKFQEHFDVKIALTVRRQDLWLESWYLQNVKWQWDPLYHHDTFDAFYAKRGDFHWIDYNTYLTNLEALFGQENIIVNVHERGQMPSGPIDAFCDSIGLTNRQGFKAPARINESYSPMISELMRRLPLDEARPILREMINHWCAELDRSLHPDAAPHSSLLLRLDERQNFMAGFAPGNTAVAQRYFGRDQLFFDPLPDADAPLAEMRLPDRSDVLIDQMVAPLMKNLISHWNKRIGQQKGRIEELEAALAQAKKG